MIVLLKAFGRKDIAKLIKKNITDKRGHNTTVWVRPDGHVVHEEKHGEKAGTMQRLLAFLGFGKGPEAEKKAIEHVRAEYVAHDVKAKYGIGADAYADHVAEYLAHRDKWDAHIEKRKPRAKSEPKEPRERKEPKPKADKGDGDIDFSEDMDQPDEPKERAPREKKEVPADGKVDGYDLAVMEHIAALYKDRGHGEHRGDAEKGVRRSEIPDENWPQELATEKTYPVNGGLVDVEVRKNKKGESVGYSVGVVSADRKRLFHNAVGPVKNPSDQHDEVYRQYIKEHGDPAKRFDQENEKQKPTASAAAATGPTDLVSGRGKLGIHVIKYPTGKFGFVGSGIPAELSYERKDGQPLTEKQKGDLQLDPGMAKKLHGIQSVAFDSEEAAKQALADYGKKKDAPSAATERKAPDDESGKVPDVKRGAFHHETFKKGIGQAIARSAAIRSNEQQDLVKQHADELNKVVEKVMANVGKTTNSDPAWGGSGVGGGRNPFGSRMTIVGMGSDGGVDDPIRHATGAHVILSDNDGKEHKVPLLRFVQQVYGKRDEKGSPMMTGWKGKIHVAKERGDGNDPVAEKVPAATRPPVAAKEPTDPVKPGTVEAKREAIQAKTEKNVAPAAHDEKKERAAAKEIADKLGISGGTADDRTEKVYKWMRRNDVLPSSVKVPEGETGIDKKGNKTGTPEAIELDRQNRELADAIEKKDHAAHPALLAHLAKDKTLKSFDGKDHDFTGVKVYEKGIGDGMVGHRDPAIAKTTVKRMINDVSSGSRYSKADNDVIISSAFLAPLKALPAKDAQAIAEGGKGGTMPNYRDTILPATKNATVPLTYSHTIEHKGNYGTVYVFHDADGLAHSISEQALSGIASVAGVKNVTELKLSAQPKGTLLPIKVTGGNIADDAEIPGVVMPLRLDASHPANDDKEIKNMPLYVPPAKGKAKPEAAAKSHVYRYAALRQAVHAARRKVQNIGE